MKRLRQVIVAAATLTCAYTHAQSVAENPAIDMPGFLRVSVEAATAREARRI
ncbi:MAG TPA: hypothetical protein VNQ74_06860 [Burkholderiaceae bacterium]|nr:hypothetical protein [Burkholderiaceae bacterium]